MAKECLKMKLQKHIKKKREVDYFMLQYSRMFEVVLSDIDYNEEDQKYNDPSSKASRVILWLLSIEPSFFNEINRAAIEMDTKNL